MVIKITSSEIIQEGRKIKVIIDRVGRNEFVYPADKFSSKQELIEDIEKSIAKEEKLKTESEQRINSLKADLGI